MEGAKIGIWCAHGEGKAKFPSAKVYEDVLAQDLAPVRCPILHVPPLSNCSVYSSMQHIRVAGSHCTLLQSGHKFSVSTMQQ